MSVPPPDPVQPAVDPSYVAARGVLLDALIALQPQMSAVIVAGAQAIYLRTGHGDLAVAPYTTDGDLAIDPSRLDDDPKLEAAMRAAGFELSLIDGHVEPGIWITSATVDGNEVIIPIDLIVPEAVAPPGGRRGARLGIHGRRAARRASGLEAALVDHSLLPITALDPHDSRVVEALVAGEAALLVAKSHKIHDRQRRGRVDRIDDKDAADVVRLMQTTDPATVGATLAALTGHPVAGVASTDALAFVDELFGRVGRPGIEMATRALQLAIPQATIETLCVAYTRELRRSAAVNR
jgi:hypothetical protein